MSVPYACQPEDSRGRGVREAESTFRDCFQRDRDRIIHSSAFRRLKYKTQVFIKDEGDYYCTRLTHSLEVAQIARTLASALGVNCALSEAIALAHDLGHPPFAHTGEEALAEKMADMGGFDHNMQAFRIVSTLECHYADFDGLNLSWETLEGIAKHNGPLSAPFASWLGGFADSLDLGAYAALEAQIAALSDDIAYVNRDIQDGLRAGLFETQQLKELPLFEGAFEAAEKKWPKVDPMRRQHEVLRAVFGMMVCDVIETARTVLAERAPQSADDVRNLGRAVVMFSPEMGKHIKVLSKFLFKNMYFAPSVLAKRVEAKKIVCGLFDRYMHRPAYMPREWRANLHAKSPKRLIARQIADYLSGMTDRFAYQEAVRLGVEFEKF